MRQILALSGIALALALGTGCGDVEFNAPEWPEWPQPNPDDVSVTWEWRGHVAAGQDVEIKSIFGGIRGVEAAGGEVVVRATKIGPAELVDDVSIEVVPHESGVTICAVYPDVAGHAPNSCEPGDGGNMTVWEGGRGTVRVNFEVEVPDGVNLIARSFLDGWPWT